MFSLYSDCVLSLFIPALSEWNNYNEDNLYERPDYNYINKILNIIIDYYILSTSPENDENFNNIEFLRKIIKDKVEKFFN